MTLSGKCLYTGHTRSWLFVSQLLVSISIHCSFVPEYTRLFLQWFHSSAFHWPYYSPHSNNCWSVQHKATTMHATLLQSRLTLYDPMDDSLPGSSVHGDSPGKNIGVGCRALLHRIFWPRNRTCLSYVSFIGKRVCFFFFLNPWATWEAQTKRCWPPVLIHGKGFLFVYFFFCLFVSFCLLFLKFLPDQLTVLEYHLGILQFNSILTLSTWR